ncbi:MAG: protein-export chaperone SecB [Bacteroidales bacterium]|nr:protein-export chaperone SecB [Bacteroidales bacterium]
MKGQHSSFVFNGYLIQESHIKREPKTKEDEFHIKIDPVGNYFEITRDFQLTLKVKVWEKNNRFNANVTCIGFFSFAEGAKEKELSTYFYTNAPAILFPYIRSYIAALTALSGMEVIHIPTLNLTNLSDELMKNTTIVKGD